MGRSTDSDRNIPDFAYVIIHGGAMLPGKATIRLRIVRFELKSTHGVLKSWPCTSGTHQLFQERHVDRQLDRPESLEGAPTVDLGTNVLADQCFEICQSTVKVVLPRLPSR